MAAYFNIVETFQSIAIVWSFCGLLAGYSLQQLKPKKDTLQKQLTVNILHSYLLKKSFFYLHLVDELIYWSKHLDRCNAYLWHLLRVLQVMGFNWEPWYSIIVSHAGREKEMHWEKTNK